MTTTVTYSIELQHRATHPATTKRGNNARKTITLKRRFTAVSITYTHRQNDVIPYTGGVHYRSHRQGELYTIEFSTGYHYGLVKSQVNQSENL